MLLPFRKIQLSKILYCIYVLHLELIYQIKPYLLHKILNNTIHKVE
jgi:hypothetical protein